MKKLRIVLTFLLFAVLCIQPLTAFAATEFSDGVYTFVKTEYNNALITDCGLTEEKIEVPEFVLGYPVAGIGDYAFFSNSYVKEVVLPPAVISVGEYAFADNAGLETVTIPRWCESIADNAFWNSPEVTINCYYDTTAYTYAIKSGISYELLDGVKLGDTNGDGYVDIGDVTAIQRHLADLRHLEGIYLLAADANCDDGLDITDATTLQKYLVEYKIPYLIGEPIKG